MSIGKSATGRVKITDGTDEATVRSLSNSNPLDVALVDTNGDQLTSLGGVQYTEGDIDTSITGPAILAEETATSTLRTLQTKQLGTQVASTDYGIIANVTVHGLSTAGSGAFVDMKVNPSGSVEVGTVAAVTSITNVVHVDDNGGSITVDGTVGVSGSVAVTGPLTDTQLRATPVPISGTVTANAGTGTFAVSAASLPLPTGAATESTLSTLNTKIPSNLTVSSTRLLVDGSGVTQPVSGTIAATQSGTWNTRLQDGAGSAVNKGQTTMSGSLPVVIASDQSAVSVSASGNSTIVSVTPTISTTAYSADDQIGGQQTITNAVRSSGGTATLHSITIIDKAKQNADIDILFFDQSTTIASSDNAALDISDANMGSNCIGVVKIRGSDYSNISGSSVVSVRNVGLTLDATGSANLYSVAKINGAATYGGTSDLVFKYHFLQD